MTDAGIDGATLIPATGTGLFRGLRENATVIEILTPDADIHAPSRIANLAESIRQANYQHSVLAMRPPTL